MLNFAAAKFYHDSLYDSQNPGAANWAIDLLFIHLLIFKIDSKRGCSYLCWNAVLDQVLQSSIEGEGGWVSMLNSNVNWNVQFFKAIELEIKLWKHFTSTLTSKFSVQNLKIRTAIMVPNTKAPYSRCRGILNQKLMSCHYGSDHVLKSSLFIFSLLQFFG